MGPGVPQDLGGLASRRLGRRRRAGIHDEPVAMVEPDVPQMAAQIEADQRELRLAVNLVAKALAAFKPSSLNVR